MTTSERLVVHIKYDPTKEDEYDRAEIVEVFPKCEAEGEHEEGLCSSCYLEEFFGECYVSLDEYIKGLDLGLPESECLIIISGHISTGWWESFEGGREYDIEFNETSIDVRPTPPTDIKDRLLELAGWLEEAEEGLFFKVVSIRKDVADQLVKDIKQAANCVAGTTPTE